MGFFCTVSVHGLRLINILNIEPEFEIKWSLEFAKIATTRCVDFLFFLFSIWN